MKSCLQRSFRASLLALAVLLFPQLARAQSDCPPELAAWARACAAQQDITLVPTRCPDGQLILVATAPAGLPLEIEVTPGASGGFRRVGPLGLSPITQLPDWQAAPPPLRHAFDAVAACVERGPAPPLHTLTTSRPPDEARCPPAPLPHRLLTALLLAAVALGLLARRAHLRLAGALTALTALTWLLRRLLLPPAFFHQNGQGAAWIEKALGASSLYGPGYHELHGALAQRAPQRADLLIFEAHAALSALAPACAWAIARAAGARPPLAWSLALALALSPGLARLALSESYYTAIVALLLAAAALLAVCTPARRLQRRLTRATIAFPLALVAAGLLVAQAARIHPIAWIPGALVPLTTLPGPGPLRRRLAHTALATAVIGLVALLAAGPAVLDIVRGSLGAQWLPASASPSRHALRWAPAAIPAVALLAVLLQRRAPNRRFRMGAWLLLGLLLAQAHRAAHIFGREPAWIELSYSALYLGPFLAVIGGLLGEMRPGRRALHVAAVLLAAALAYHVTHAREQTALPTDALDAAFFRASSDQLPESTTVLYLSQARHPTRPDEPRSPRTNLFLLPVYTTCGEPRVRVLPSSAEYLASPAVLPTTAPYYYRTSLCSTAEGRAACEHIESTFRLTPVAERELPARPSHPLLVYLAPTVRVGLYRVEGYRAEP
ncbi:hypothetical protein [Chondromyces crocatus]|uniref:Glycosyltransferase RgtA/B/C/D-like domain-containing protein n=1 Tax=Chondromyces crocatus TaxID=52 RepID=A0A0K1EQ46_CHOCO|nr:hypothetical protein [Chondromyces crocatus]AKT42971.1 uncharacterized protein CMC5_071990 [Chondromyces crocatus]